MTGWDYDSTCVCGHVLDEHDLNTMTCTIEGCLCAGHEPVDEEDRDAS